MSVTVRTLARDEIQDRLRDLARLRVAVFREWPYLYDGDASYESDYLTAFANAPDAVLVAAFDGADIIGMATASPMAAQGASVREPVAAAGFDLSTTFYFGESVLLPGYRGQGIGHAFFDHREAGARHAGARTATFCAVIRPDDHPLRPPAARSHAVFWTGRGYRSVPGLTCTMTWRDLDTEGEVAHDLQFWSRTL
ncbi:MAG: GNAT family N-acetyltransferase [Alphaproteobacteria bacterium HGW-Alphaproteobacteria-16]|nr:MAG: GNAT family N-acetyltransferase [Alphaproteobacteria bacterium HGW-Alphaproteobacteria-16]